MKLENIECTVYSTDYYTHLSKQYTYCILLIIKEEIRNSFGAIIEQEELFPIYVGPTRLHLVDGLEKGDQITISFWLNSKTYRTAANTIRHKVSLQLSALLRHK